MGNQQTKNLKTYADHLIITKNQFAQHWAHARSTSLQLSQQSSALKQVMLSISSNSLKRADLLANNNDYFYQLHQLNHQLNADLKQARLCEQKAQFFYQQQHCRSEVVAKFIQMKQQQYKTKQLRYEEERISTLLILGKASKQKAH